MVAAQYIITPWRTPSDLLSVRQALYTPPDTPSHLHAIKLIAAWKLRGNLPHAVESSGLLFSAAAFHTSKTSRNLENAVQTHNDPGSNFAIRAAYTQALSRFVTGFADVGRHRAGLTQSMQEVAKSIHLPTRFVEMRHEATHGEMPNLDRLRTMTTEALHWLWQTYWARLDQDIESAGAARREAQAKKVDEDTAHRDELRKVLKTFRSKRVAAIGAAAKGRGQSEKTLVVSTVEQCVAIGCRDTAPAFVELLVDEQLMLPTKTDKFRYAGPRCVYSRSLTICSISGHTSATISIWDKLLVALVSKYKSLLELLLEHMVQALLLVDLDTVDPRTIFAEWIRHISCHSALWRETASWAGVPQADNALQLCCLHPNATTTRLAASLLDIKRDSGDEPFVQRWQTIIESCNLGSQADESSLDTHNDHMPLSLQPGWHRDNTTWRPTPIGVPSTA